MKRILPWLAFVTIGLIGLASAWLVWSADQRNRLVRFGALAEESVGRVQDQVGRHMLLIEATAAMFELQRDWIRPDEFRAYFNHLDLVQRSPGSVGLGYAVFARPTERAALERAYMVNNNAPLQIWPKPEDTPGHGTDPDQDSDFLAVAVLFESVEPGQILTSGFDAYSDPIRRAAIDAAIAAGQPRATGTLALVNDPIKARQSFLIYAPVYTSTFGIPARGGAPRLPTGFVIAAFRMPDLLSAALDVTPHAPVNVTVSQADDPDAASFLYGDLPDPSFGDAYTARHQIDVAGQSWTIVVRPTAGFRPPSVGLLAPVLGLVSLLLAGAAALLLRAQQRAHDSAEAMADSTQRNLAEKELLLQEMKHRIKNAIARILAMARQTAAHADSLESFTQSFTQRLQAMANAQDVLTRSKWQRADLGELIGKELTQVFGPDFDASGLNGPAVELDERTTQALGLTFHELATNTLKYAGAQPQVDISWSADGHSLRIDWCETGAGGVTQPVQTGFGTRLIEANVRHELGGRIERDFRPSGLRVVLTVPLPVLHSA